MKWRRGRKFEKKEGRSHLEYDFLMFKTRLGESMGYKLSLDIYGDLNA